MADQNHRAVVFVERFGDNRQMAEVDVVGRLVQNQKPGFCNTSLAKATKPFCPSDNRPIFVLIISALSKNPAAIARMSSSIFFSITAIKASLTVSSKLRVEKSCR